MRCPYCGSPKSRVIETREADVSIRRRRQCGACQLRFTTYERPQPARLVVRTAGGVQRNFTRGWLEKALRATGVELPVEQLRSLSSATETLARAGGTRLVSTADIGHAATRGLLQISQLTSARAMRLSPEEIAAALDASTAARRPRPSQLLLPLEE